MEQGHDSQNNQNNDRSDQQQARIKLIWTVSHTAIAIWALLIGVGLLWLWISDHVPLATRAQVFIESVFSLAIVIVIVVHAVMYYKQASEANKQANAMERSLVIGEQQRDFMHLQADAMRKQLDEMIGQKRAMESQLVAMKEQSALIDKSIQTAELNAIYANRAYLVAKIRNNEPYQFKLAIENGGNTPANNVIVCYACRVMQDPPWRLDKQTGQVVYDAGFDIEVRLGVIAPNGSHGTVWTVAFTPRTDNERQEWENGVKLFCWGRIYYEDMFNKGRHTDFCFYKSHERPEGYPSEYCNEVL
jgi:hypothetical protein